MPCKENTWFSPMRSARMRGRTPGSCNIRTEKTVSRAYMIFFWFEPLL